ncbi:MAG TPA: hypothetical protein VNO21_05755 [Polyangiaceae bacterium]|nr:hypothetical protein [Polyangiaceae bacterium]
MATTSARVRRIVDLVGELSDDERAELEAELLVEDEDVARAWGQEIDVRARRALAGETAGLSRSQLDALFEMKPEEARSKLERILASRK